jgi:hypothetical protein
VEINLGFDRNANGIEFRGHVSFRESLSLPS